MVRSLIRWLLVAAGSVLLGLVLIGAGLYWHFLRSGPQPSPWHEVPLPDFTAQQAAGVDSLDDYLAIEQQAFGALQAVYQPANQPGAVFNRYRAGSRSDPGRWPVNWNRTFRLGSPPGVAPRGAVLLLHGLTDSPYSMRSIGEHLAAQGYAVVGLRLPGHGTAPSGLLSFRIEDMQAAVSLVARDLHARAPGQPLYLMGYSNGAALAVVGRFKTGLSSVPGFSRAAWQTIVLEFDPYKYNSFSFHAAGETLRLTRDVARRVEQLAGGQALPGFPPVLAFLSTVDATIRAEAVVDVLLEHLAPGDHELVLFDVNRYGPVQEFLVDDPGPLTERLRALPRRPYALTVITNTPGTQQVMELRTAAGTGATERRDLPLYWPQNVFSLSHVALPFPPDDPLYGYEAVSPADHVQLGKVAIRGESGVLNVPNWALTRHRSNPFHSYLVERIDGFLAASSAP
jgi:hypothetical protein